MITLQFKAVPHRLFLDAGELPPNRLSLVIQPNESVHLRFEAKRPGSGMRAEPVNMVFRYGSHFGDYALPDAYERLLLDAIQGDASLFARSDEIELAWRLTDNSPFRRTLLRGQQWSRTGRHVHRERRTPLVPDGRKPSHDYPEDDGQIPGEDED